MTKVKIFSKIKEYMIKRLTISPFLFIGGITMWLGLFISPFMTLAGMFTLLGIVVFVIIYDRNIDKKVRA